MVSRYSYPCYHANVLNIIHEKIICLLVGPQLPQTCDHPSIVQSPDGQGVILLGCFENGAPTDAIYELVNSDDNGLMWNKMSQKLKYPRYDTVAMLIPDELANCY